jgi:hypothetical protein
MLGLSWPTLGCSCSAGAGTGADDRTIDASHRYFFRVFGFVLYRLIVEIVDRPSVSSALIVLIPSHFQATNINP